LELRAEIIFIDDGSTDGSREALRALTAEDPLCRVIIFRVKSGKATALQAGFDIAQGEYVLTLDGDLQDDPADIPRFLTALQTADVVSAWRMPPHAFADTPLAPDLLNRIARAVTGVRLHDIGSGWKGYRRQVLREVAIYGELHRFLPALAAARGFRIAELRVKHHPRDGVAGKQGRESLLRALLDLITVTYITRYSRRPLQLFGGLGAAFTLIGLALGAVLSPYLTIAGIKPPAWHFFMWLLALALIVLGPLFIALGLLAEAQLASTLPHLPPPPVAERINCVESEQGVEA